MDRKFIFFLFIFSLLFANQEENYNFLRPTSVSVTDNALSKYTNPAAIGFRQSSQLYTIFPFRDRNRTPEFSGIYMGKDFSFSGEYIEKPENGGFQRWQISSGASIFSNITIGSSYRWYGTFDYGYEIDIGAMARFKEWISIGAHWKNIQEKNNHPEYLVSGLGVRPFGDRFTIAADVRYDMSKSNELGKKLYMDVEPIPGIKFYSSYGIENQKFAAGLNYNFSNIGIGINSYKNKESSFSRGAVTAHFSPNEYRSIMTKGKKNFAVLNLSGKITEQGQMFSSRPFSDIRSFIKNINTLAESEKIDGLIIKFDNLSAGYTQMLELRNALSKFKATGKPIYCYVNSLSNGKYFLASVSDNLYLNPSGSVWLTGLSATKLYFREAFNKLGIKPEFEYIGEYKSAHEPLTRENRSEADEVQMESLISDFYSVYTEKVGNNRDKSPEEIKNIIDNGPYAGPEAKEKELVDSLIYEDELKECISSNIKDEIRFSSATNFINTPPYKTDWDYKDKQAGKIALIYANGTITTGKSKRNFAEVKSMGSETIANAIEKARKLPYIKAIVLRVDSPGGSALASEIILRQVKKTVSGENRKPLIISMGDVAASGGYYIASLADTIVANPTTTTGSIGVLGGKISIKNLMDKAGINSHTIKKGKNSNMNTIFRDWTEEERKEIREQISWVYETFIEHVSEGRNMKKRAVDSIGRGRVWSGKRAKENNLVDVLGGLRTSVKIAAEKAGIDGNIKNMNMMVLPSWWDYSFEIKLSTFFNNKNAIEKNLPEEYNKAKTYFNCWLMNKNEKTLMMLPYWLIIE